MLGAHPAALLFRSKNTFVISFSRAQQMEDDARQFVSRRRDRLGSSQPAAHPAIVVSQIGVAPVQSLSRQAQAAVEPVLVLRVLADSTLPPLLSAWGQSPNQEAKAAALGKRDTSRPISPSKVCTLRALSPGTAVRSTPRMRYNSLRKSKRNSFLRGRWGLGSGARGFCSTSILLSNSRK